MTTEPLAQHPDDDAAWNEIQRFVDETAALVDADVSTTSFYSQLIERVTRAMAAVGGIVWLHSANRWVPTQHSEIDPNVVDAELHERLVVAMTNESRTKMLAPQSQSKVGLANPTEHLLLLAPVQHAGEVIAVIEILHRPTLHPTVQRGNERLLEMFREIAVDYHRQRELTTLRQRERQRETLSEFAYAIHRHADVQTTAFAIANESRVVLGCDRVSVVQSRSRGCRTLAVSGVDSLDPRANSIQQLETLAGIVLQTGEPISYGVDDHKTTPELHDALQRYVDTQHLRSVILLPLLQPSPTNDKADDLDEPVPLGVLVIERFDADVDDELRDRANYVCQHASLALARAIDTERVPFVRPLRWLSQTSTYLFVSQLRLTLIVALLLTAVIAALCFTPTDFQVRARGELQPLHRQHLFAPLDGQIIELRTQHDAQVEAGTILAEMRSTDLDLQRQELQGRLDTIRKRLPAIASQRVLERQSNARDNAANSQLAADEEQLRIEESSIEKQLAILNEQRDALTLRSPMDGHVLTWDIDQLLSGRPVRRGQALLTIAETTGKWVAELRVPDDQIDHVLAAAKKQEEPIAVTFMVMNEPETIFHGTVREVAAIAELGEDSESTVLVTVDVDRSELHDVRPGTTVIGKLHCGRTSLGNAWFHELLEAIHTWVFL